ncbi:MAG: hypothetical protein K2W96_26425, partial [Gemmataceae bacterium]|nr:hypothetical protein [Gemmataceae bacterium]
TGASQPAPLPHVAKKLVMEKCGRLVRKVDASLDDAGKLTLRIHAKPRAHQELTGQLLQIPEFATNSNVHFEIRLGE